MYHSEIATTCMGVQVPVSPFLTETRLQRIASARYERDEIRGALDVVCAGDRVMELGAGLGIVGAVVALNAEPAALLSFEANPDMVPHIRSLYAANGLQDMAELRNEVLMSGPDKPDTVPFHVHKSFLGSSLIDTPKRKTRAVQVPTADFNAVRAAYRPDVLILDIEGGERDLLDHADLTGIRAVVIEFHPKVYGTDGMKACKAALRRAGFSKREEVSTRLVWTCDRDLADHAPPSPAGGWSDRIVTLERRTVIPPARRQHVQATGVLTRQGHLVPEAALWRNARLLTEPPHAPDDPPERLPGRWLWGGIMWRYFPHFITESVARLWALDRIDMTELDGILFTPKNPKPKHDLAKWHFDFLALCGCTLPLHEAFRPCRPGTLIVPGQGFGLGEISSGTAAFRDSMKQRFAPDIAPDGPEKLYISRSKLGAWRGALLGEALLEAHLQEQGYKVFHPQDHPLAVQVARYRAARQVIAAEGSALHVYAFAGQPGQRVAIILRRKSLATRHIASHITQFTGSPPLQIDVLRGAWQRKHTPRRRLAVGVPDFAALQDRLVEGGFISAGMPWPQMTRDAIQAELGDDFVPDATFVAQMRKRMVQTRAVSSISMR